MTLNAIRGLREKPLKDYSAQKWLLWQESDGFVWERAWSWTFSLYDHHDPQNRGIAYKRHECFR